MGQAVNEAGGDRIGNVEHDYWDRLGRLLQAWVPSARRDQYDLETNEFGGERGQPLELIISVAKLEGDGLAVDVAELTEPLESRRCALYPVSPD